MDPGFITGVDNPVALAIDDAHIYWVTSGSIGRANLDGSGVDESFIGGIGDPCSVAVNDAHIYWDDGFNFTIGRANLDGSGVDQGFISEGVDSPCGLAVDDAHIYWNDPAISTIGRANLDGRRVDGDFLERKDGVDGACRIAVDDAHVYWTNFETIGRANLDGSGGDASFIGGADLPCDIAVDGLPFSFGKVKKNKRKGTAKLTVNVPSAGGVELDKTRKVKGADKQADAEGSVRLRIKPRGPAKKRVNQKGKAKVKADVTFTPEGGEPDTQSKPLKLIKRR